MRNKKYLLILSGLVLVVLLGLGLVVREKLVGLQRENKLSNEDSSVYFDEIIEETVEAEHIEKTFISEDEKLFYTFTAKVVEGLYIQPGGPLRGTIIIDGDEKEREISIRFSPFVDIYFGVFEESFEGGSVWNTQPVEKVAKLIRPGTRVQLNIIHHYGAVEDKYKEYFYEQDKVLDELLADIAGKKWEYQVSGNYTLRVDSLGVVL